MDHEIFRAILWINCDPLREVSKWTILSCINRCTLNNECSFNMYVLRDDCTRDLRQAIIYCRLTINYQEREKNLKCPDSGFEIKLFFDVCEGFWFFEVFLDLFFRIFWCFLNVFVFSVETLKQKITTAAQFSVEYC